MSVLNPVISHIDGTLRRIYLAQGVSDYFPIEDIYHEYRDRRRNDEDLRKYEPLIKAEGNVPKGGGAFTPRYVVLLDGTKIVPYDESLQINQLGDMITDDPDTDATLYDISGLTTAKPIFIKPSESEIIQLNSKSIEYSSFDGGVTIDVINGEAGVDGGTGTPIGTHLRPSNNEEDAHAIALINGFKRIYVIGDLELIEEDIDWIGFEFIGESRIKSLITVDPLADVFNCEFKNATVSGTLDGTSQIEDSTISGLDFVDGYMIRCSIGPDEISLGTSTICNIYSSFSTVPGTNTPSINCNATGVLALRDYNGGILIKNYTGSDSHSIDLASGKVILDSTVTSGTWVIRGVGKIVDTNGVEIPNTYTYDENGNITSTNYWNGGVTIINDTLNKEGIELSSSQSTQLKEIWQVQGLDDAAPLVVTPNQITTGGIDIDLTGDGKTIKTATRQ